MTVRLENLSIFYSFKAIRRFTLARPSRGTAQPRLQRPVSEKMITEPLPIFPQGIGVPTHGIATTIFWMIVGWRAMRAHERIAEASEQALRRFRETTSEKMRE